MFNRSKAAGLLAAIVAVAAGCGSSAADESGNGGSDSGELVFASVPSESSTSLAQEFAPLISMLEKETGKKIKVQKATNYAAIIEGQRSKKIDIALYGPLSYILAKDSGVPLDVVAAETQSRTAKPGYHSYGIVPGKSDLTSVAQFKGKKVCLVDPNSTSGYLFPESALLQNKMTLKDVTPVMTGGHDASVLSVKKGQCDAGFAEDVMVDKLLPAKGQLKPGDVKIVWKSPLIPGSPVAISSGLDPKLKKKITDAFATKANADYLKAHGYCSGACTLDSFWGFRAVKDSFYNGVRKVCRLTKDKQCTSAS
ncbi:MAG TPA: phosphate/phosphite/phosphonate ABC transporter substrate-binding protein [Mycobacteriales bacterium]|nr:phosphate/phosphite/phosphonate ABC transporter substrate-binding protein [Mycobacteriales bacterium]